MSVAKCAPRSSGLWLSRNTSVDEYVTFEGLGRPVDLHPLGTAFLDEQYMKDKCSQWMPLEGDGHSFDSLSL